MTGTPHLPRKRVGASIYKPKCIDCGETNRAKFYSHPTSRSGCQSRCKPCDNKKRMGNYRRGNGGGVEAVRRPDGSIALVRRSPPPSSVANSPSVSKGSEVGEG